MGAFIPLISAAGSSASMTITRPMRRHYHYAGDADDCHGSGGERISGINAWDI